MPFKRFENLHEEKKERLLEVAAQEFAAFGFEQASFNRILEQAQMGKGSAYYYFANKADLFEAVIDYAAKALNISELTIDPSTLNAENLWDRFAEIRRETLLRSHDRPWLFRVIKRASQETVLPDEQSPLTRAVRQVTVFMQSFIKRGQELGIIRADVPVDLLLGWLIAIDQASDEWLMSHWNHMNKTEISAISNSTVASMRGALAPLSAEICPDG